VEGRNDSMTAPRNNSSHVNMCPSTTNINPNLHLYAIYIPISSEEDLELLSESERPTKVTFIHHQNSGLKRKTIAGPASAIMTPPVDSSPVIAKGGRRGMFAKTKSNAAVINLSRTTVPEPTTASNGNGTGSNSSSGSGTGSNSSNGNASQEQIFNFSASSSPVASRTIHFKSAAKKAKNMPRKIDDTAPCSFVDINIADRY
jgi:hypothetical protein